MRIALRPSGGRGDYELAGSFGGLHASDLLEKQFSFQLTPNLVIDGKAVARRLSGKPRIRPDVDGLHAYVIAAAILLLPVPRRELIKTPEGAPLLANGEYTIAGIDVDVVTNLAGSVTFAPTAIWGRSQGGLLKIEFADRMALVTNLWSAADSLDTPIAGLVRAHYTAVVSSEHKKIADAAKAIRSYYAIEGDLLPALLSAMGLTDPNESSPTGLSSNTGDFAIEDKNSTSTESLKERVRKWRLQADRGPGAREFSKKVRDAYDHRCLFSGERFPRIDGLDSAGVDGAHVLPWSTHQLNSVTNGICLCKQCHWGFDNGLLRLDFDTAASTYVLSIPKGIEAVAKEAKFDLQPFLKNSGVIPSVRLPANEALWPSPHFIAQLNAIPLVE
jgi:hypothetical protein